MAAQQHPTADQEPGNRDAQSGAPVADGLPTRRDFLAGAVAVSGAALSGMPELVMAQIAAPKPAGSGQEVEKIGEIGSQDGRLRAVIAVRNAERTIPADPNAATQARTLMLRYFEGKDAAGHVVWPPPSVPDVVPAPRPGPTLRTRVGDKVEITLLNHVNADEFGGTIDRAETGEVIGCDAVVKALDGTKFYPQEAGDAAPNCFHGSSTMNIHFHGTHVTPDGLGDNVLLQLRPNPAVTEDSVRDDFAKIFAADPPPAHWIDLPQSWTKRQLELLEQYDDTAVWQGRRGTPGHPALPLENRLLPPTLKLIRNGYWPQYQIGAYPYCFRLTKFSVDAQGKPTFTMGQCPGTHWYHAHKHGSTAINVLNGMAGAFVIEGDYDDALAKIYPNLKQSEKVLIVQNLGDSPSLMAGRGSPSLWVNGQFKPTITMRPGEIQLWRLINASVRAVLTLVPFGPEAANVPAMRQLAQDGVQFCVENYKAQPLLTSGPNGGPRASAFAAGNRMDLLVKAPLQPGSFDLQVDDPTQGTSTLLTLKVAGEPIDPPMQFPTEAAYPAFPPFLRDIGSDEIRVWRKLDFGWEPKRTGPGRTPPAPKFMIDGHQFTDGKYSQTMILGDCEEWTLNNSTSVIAHPFHIHVNPFQVVEIYDPKTDTTYKPAGNYVWQDVIAIPPSLLDNDGKVVKQGYVKIRHRFADFTGSYVLHCHMLAHEDRGMMQLVRVISNEALVSHH